MCLTMCYNFSTPILPKTCVKTFEPGQEFYLPKITHASAKEIGIGKATDKTQYTTWKEDGADKSKLRYPCNKHKYVYLKQERTL